MTRTLPISQRFRIYHERFFSSTCTSDIDGKDLLVYDFDDRLVIFMLLKKHGITKYATTFYRSLPVRSCHNIVQTRRATHTPRKKYRITIHYSTSFSRDHTDLWIWRNLIGKVGKSYTEETPVVYVL